MGIDTILSAVSSPAFAATYQPQDNLNSTNWLEAFSFGTTHPDNGFVQYLEKPAAINSSLYRTVGSSVYVGANYTTPLNVAVGRGRASVRMKSNKVHNQDLYVIDISQMPSFACGGTSSWDYTIPRRKRPLG